MDSPKESLNVITAVCPNAMSGQRVDRALAALVPDQSRAALQRLLDRGLVLVDGAAVKPAFKVRGGETIAVAIPPPETISLQPEDLGLEILFEDDELVVVNKRPGMVAHPSPGHRDGTLVNALLHHCAGGLSGVGGEVRPGIVHRLDKDTSGCLVAAKNDASHRALMQQFMSRETRKTYLALTDGVPKPLSGRVEGKIGRHPVNRRLHAMLKSGGRESLTLYETRENHGVLALVSCELHTGRTHQARVHLASVGAPVLCDSDYGRRKIYTDVDLLEWLELVNTGRLVPGRHAGKPAKVLLSRQALHAWRLSFRHPVSGAWMEFEAPMPGDMLGVLEAFRAGRRRE